MGLLQRLRASTMSMHPQGPTPGGTPLADEVLTSSGPQTAAANGEVRHDGSPARARAYADLMIDNAPDPVFVSDLEGKIIQANDAVSQLLGFRQDEVVEQSLSRFISPEETREFTAALREVVEHGVTRNARLNPRSASGEIIPTRSEERRVGKGGRKRMGPDGMIRYERELDEAW